MDRHIVCFAVPSFELALARVQDASLRTRPLAIASLASPRSLLREVSDEAAREGLSPGISVDFARRLCPGLSILPPNPRRTAEGMQSVLNVVSQYAPVWEPAQSGSFVMDVSGTSRLFGPACDVAARVQAEVWQRYALDGMAGVASNKLVSQTAVTLLGAAELYHVRPGSERLFMSPLSVDTLPGLHRPCMKMVRERLHDINLLTLGDIADSPVEALALALGDSADVVSRWAQGIDSAPVLLPTAQPVLERTVTLEPDEIDDPVLLGRLADALQGLCRVLRQQRRVCYRLTVLVRYSDQIEVTKWERVIPETCWEYDLAPLLTRVFYKCVRRRIRIRLMTLTLSGLSAFTEQCSLFPDRSVENERRRERAQRLSVALDALHRRFGDQTIRYGRSG